jgi:membrane protein implicated in regulation of membrane protease activity
MAEFEIGLAFIVIGIVLLMVEATSPGFFIAVPATVLILIGGLAMLIPGFFTSPWSPITALVVGSLATVFTIKLYARLAPPQAPMTTVGTSLIGKSGTVTKEVVPDSIAGKVNIENQIWSATSNEVIPVGARVQVVGSAGVHVVVEKFGKGIAAAGASAKGEGTRDV